MVEAKDDEDDGADQRDTNLAKREAGLAVRLETVERILDAAKERDIEADARDRVSVERDHAADLKAFTSPDGSNAYGVDLPARRHAAMDRRDAKGDRASAADDRVALTGVADDLPVAEGTEEKEERREVVALDRPSRSGLTARTLRSRTNVPGTCPSAPSETSPPNGTSHSSGDGGLKVCAPAVRSGPFGTSAIRHERPTCKPDRTSRPQANPVDISR